MTQNKGVPPQAGSGCQPAASAAEEASSQSGIPNADERLAELLALEENWNSYHARPVDRAVAERVRAVFPLLAKLGLSPWICPLSDGSLQIERAGTDDYCIEFNRDGTASVNFDGLSDKDAFGFLSQFALISALNRAAASAMSAGTASPMTETPSIDEELIVILRHYAKVVHHEPMESAMREAADRLESLLSDRAKLEERVRKLTGGLDEIEVLLRTIGILNRSTDR